jgi:hypothetical protein
VRITKRHFPADETQLFGSNLLLSDSVSAWSFAVIRSNEGQDPTAAYRSGMLA